MFSQLLKNIAIILALSLALPLHGHELNNPDGAQILAAAREGQGGDEWANAQTLILEGRAVFYGTSGAEPRSIADDYRMWRVFDPNRNAAHGAEGKVRITAKSGEKLLFEVGFDGENTWNERGMVPKAEADKFWANNFGFGIIRHAGKPGFDAIRLPDDVKGGHRVFMVELTDPNGGKTLFGVDKASHAIRYLGFNTERGWHVRTYDDFVRLSDPDWLQARHVTLYYDGRKANEVFWERTQVNVAIDPALFAMPMP